VRAPMPPGSAVTGSRERERGSALIIATLVSVILSLLGISYMMMAQTENTIAENERNAAMALYVAEAGARLAINWFNDPSSTGYLVPATGQVDRTLRVFDHDNDTGTARVQGSSGNAAQPLYKDATFTTSPLFDRPYRSALADTFFGVETGVETGADAGFPTAGPDLVVATSHLATINDALFPNFPSPTLRARIARIEVYGPPIVNGSRMGIATVKVTGGVFLYPGTADERQIATRVVKAVVNEIPVPGPVGPLQSCSALAYTGAFEINWGTGSSLGNATFPTGAQMNTQVDTGVPYNLNDPFTYISGGTTLASWATANDGSAIDDPWFKFITGGSITGAPNTNVQPWPYAGATPSLDHSNVFQNTVINCPTFDYNMWKSIAQSGSKNHFYFKSATSSTFQLDGTGAALTFQAATAGRTGVMFFDTRDGMVPRGLYTDTWPTTNLTDDISIASASGWPGMQGFVFVNAKSFETTGAGNIGTNRTIIPPGEVSDGSGFVNLQYPTTLTGNFTIRQAAASPAAFQDPVTGDWYCVDHTTCTNATRTPAGAPVLDPTGLPFTAQVVMDGVMYISGVFKAQGNADFFGSVVAQQGVIDGAGTPGFYFDESLIEGNWPRKGMNLPRVIVSAWQTEL
jgi:Tfp pilus assembly protein PilX